MVADTPPLYALACARSPRSASSRIRSIEEAAVRRSHETPFPTGFLRRKPTLKEWCEYWLATNAVKRPKAKKEDRSSLKLHVYPTLGHKRLEDITVFDIRLLVAQWA